MIRRLVSSMLLVPALLSAQSQQEFAARRAAVVAGMPDGVLVALGAHEPAQDYLSFVQSPSFYYLTGFKEPDAALIVVKQGGQVVSSTMFVQPRLPSREVMVKVSTGWHSHVGVLISVLNNEAPRPFWKTFLALEQEYEKRIAP